MDRKTTPLILALGLSLGISGCTLAPAYTRPEAPVPATWPGEAVTKDGPKISDAAQLAWEDFLRDPQLRALVQLALERNRNLRLAALAIERSQAQYRIQRADLLPKIDATGLGNNRAAAHFQYTASVGVSAYELDLFGRVQSLKNQALEQYLATSEAQRAVRISLIAETVSTALNLAADRDRLRLAQETLTSQEASLSLITRRFELGASSELDLRQAQTQAETVRAEVARLKAQVAQDENALVLLTGGAPLPAHILPQTLVASTAFKAISPGLSSEVLLQRPDVLQSEHQLKGYNANIGAARAAFFPRITLTDSYGLHDDQLSRLFSTSSGRWTFMPQVVLPIFDGGARLAQLKVAETDREIALTQYDKTIQTAFRETADTLAQHQALSEQLTAQEGLVAAASQRHQLARARYEQGIDSHLQLLDSERTLYSAQQGLISTRLAQLVNRATLYKVLGGGGGGPEPHS